MATLTVGAGQEYTTIAAAVAASSSGDTVNVQAGTYTNDFVTITHDLSLNATGGTVTMVATEQPPNGKAIIDEGGSGVAVSITGVDISGATVADANGAAVRYEGGTLTLSGDTIHGNQNGLLAAADPNGTITITGSDFHGNGTGSGSTHNIYVNDVASLTVENSTITAANGGHDIKSRAQATTITNNLITDGASGTASYEIDLPNGGNATVAGNIIEKGANATNPIAISYGEEGSVYGSSSLTVQNNTILNDDTAHTTTAVVNDTGTTAAITGNSLYGWSTLSSGPASASGNTTLATEPSLSSLTPGSSADTGSTSAVGTGTTSTGTTSTGTTATGTTSTDSPSTGTGNGSGDTAGSSTGNTASGGSTSVTTGTLGRSNAPVFLSGQSTGDRSGGAGSSQSSSADQVAAALKEASTQVNWGSTATAGASQTTVWGFSGADTYPQAQASLAGVVPDSSTQTATQLLPSQSS